jgi:DNA-binding GntR family transcriptional regulator
VVRVTVLWQTTGMPTRNEQTMLELAPDEHVIRAARLRLDDDVPLSYELVSVPAALLPTTNGTSALFDIQQLATANRIRLGQATETVSQVAAGRVLAKRLGIPVGSVLHKLDRLVRTLTGSPIEWRIAFVRM